MFERNNINITNSGRFNEWVDINVNLFIVNDILQEKTKIKNGLLDKDTNI